MSHHPMNPVSVYRDPWVCHISNPVTRELVRTFGWWDHREGCWCLLYLDLPKYTGLPMTADKPGQGTRANA